MLFGALCSDLTEIFLQFVSCQASEVLKEALENVSFVEIDGLVEILDNYECRRTVPTNNLPTILIQISHKELVQKPMFVIDCWRDIARPKLNLSYESLTKILCLS